MVFQAKARAEIAGGVGELTDIVLLAPGQTPMYRLTSDQMGQLYSMFRDTTAKEQQARTEAEHQLDAYINAAAQQSAESRDQRQAEAPPQDVKGQTGGDASPPPPAAEDAEIKKEPNE
jgi:hypothetical protein